MGTSGASDGPNPGTPLVPSWLEDVPAGPSADGDIAPTPDGLLGGTPPPAPEWGAMLNAGQKFIRQAWWLTVFPGVGIFLTVLAINMIGDAVSDAVAGTTPVYGKKE